MKLFKYVLLPVLIVIGIVVLLKFVIERPVVWAPTVF